MLTAAGNLSIDGGACTNSFTASGLTISNDNIDGDYLMVQARDMELISNNVTEYLRIDRDRNIMMRPNGGGASDALPTDVTNGFLYVLGGEVAVRVKVAHLFAAGPE